ncbi:MULTISPECIES: PadR family transcriptional regulator [Micromonospora]|uniref:PadR family transcriptional regulator n=1 Tax=Micromonospora solifontis TaxID=2487138 RepID=A0ABX9WF28_9ACTN|nr:MULTISPECIES: PadR family transcriptional regulator [Micromonospora]NES15789.1 PadR family transcriptional regulator [Micromonospora sp. PPF5-17B]NES38056.1 PadR family transcriptional regulator [Micromonospora solifontis]RNL97086.1 PadR family transcriptional regulator [Micromonospora solifontis]
MSTSHVLLGLLATGPRHGYELKRAHDERLPRARPLAFGQVYATLARLHRDGLVAPAGQERDGGPDRTAYALTGEGPHALDRWLATVEPPMPYVASTLFAKVVVALLVADVDRARDYLIAQRRAHTARLRELTAVKTAPTASLDDVLAADFAIAHLDADLRWLHTTLDRVADWHREVHS